ncbi:cupin domain-containing protein [Acrocarpospora macrocephala]|uniref:Cupin n=1 Tax=Acrocarpospora macrocephala TaxID=150177 RepID=A0A5M3WUC7_9ACTN|nr:cupin [Acrocarpospora macrocephala]
MQDIKRVRVVVTGDRDGRSYISSDAPASGALVQPGRPTALTDVWHVAGVPADPADSGEPPTDRPFTLAPPASGIVFRVVQFDPVSADEIAAMDGREIFAAMNASADHVGGETSPFMHRTRSLDFGLVLEGSLTMLLDDDVTEVSAGDIIIQRATSHAWENRGSQRALVAFVLVSAM